MPRTITSTFFVWLQLPQEFFVKLNYVLFYWGGHKSRYTVGGYGGWLLNKIYINVNSFFFVLFHVGGVEGTLYGYNTLNDTYVESVERNKYNCTRLVSEVLKLHNRDSSNLIVYMSEVSKLFLWT